MKHTPVHVESGLQSPADRATVVRNAVATYEGPLTSYAAKLVGDVDKARDVVQDTFLKLWTAELSQVNGHLAAWLYRVCRNRALDVCRKDERMTLVEHEQLERNEASPRLRLADHAQEPPQYAENVMAALGCLSSKQQEVIRLKFQGGLSYQEIANVMDLTANHVGVLIHTALKHLREHLTGNQTTAPGTGARSQS